MGEDVCGREWKRPGRLYTAAPATVDAPRSCNQISARQRSVAIYNDHMCIAMPQPDGHSIKVAVVLPKNHMPGTELRDRLHRQHNLLSQWLSVGQTN